MKKSPFLWQIFKTFMKLCYLPKFYHVEIFERIIAVLRIFFAFYRKVRFLCLLLSLGISYYYLFMATENCKSVCILLVFKYRSNHFLKQVPIRKLILGQARFDVRDVLKVGHSIPFPKPERHDVKITNCVQLHLWREIFPHR